MSRRHHRSSARWTNSRFERSKTGDLSAIRYWASARFPREHEEAIRKIMATGRAAMREPVSSLFRAPVWTPDRRAVDRTVRSLLETRGFDPSDRVFTLAFVIPSRMDGTDYDVRETVNASLAQRESLMTELTGLLSFWLRDVCETPRSCLRSAIPFYVQGRLHPTNGQLIAFEVAVSVKTGFFWTPLLTHAWSRILGNRVGRAYRGETMTCALHATRNAAELDDAAARLVDVPLMSYLLDLAFPNCVALCCTAVSTPTLPCAGDLLSALAPGDPAEITAAILHHGCARGLVVEKWSRTCQAYRSIVPYSLRVEVCPTGANSQALALTALSVDDLFVQLRRPPRAKRHPLARAPLRPRSRSPRRRRSSRSPTPRFSSASSSASEGSSSSSSSETDEPPATPGRDFPEPELPGPDSPGPQQGPDSPKPPQSQGPDSQPPEFPETQLPATPGRSLPEEEDEAEACKRKALASLGTRGGAAAGIYEVLSSDEEEMETSGELEWDILREVMQEPPRESHQEINIDADFVI